MPLGVILYEGKWVYLGFIDIEAPMGYNKCNNGKTDDNGKTGNEVVTKAKDSTVIIEGHLTSLGKKKDRWCVALSHGASKHLGKRTRYTITFSPVGSINPPRVLETV